MKDEEIELNTAILAWEKGFPKKLMKPEKLKADLCGVDGNCTHVQSRFSKIFYKRSLL